MQAFVNTLDSDLRTDLLAHADEARAWFTDAGLRDLQEARDQQQDGRRRQQFAGQILNQMTGVRAPVRASLSTARAISSADAAR